MIWDLSIELYSYIECLVHVHKHGTWWYKLEHLKSILNIHHDYSLKVYGLKAKVVVISWQTILKKCVLNPLHCCEMLLVHVRIIHVTSMSNLYFYFVWFRQNLVTERVEALFSWNYMEGSTDWKLWLKCSKIFIKDWSQFYWANTAGT